MRCAVPSSKVGSCDSASAAAERDSGVDAAAAGFAGVAWAGVAAPADNVVTGLAGKAAGPEPATFEPSANAGTLASIVAMATIVILRMSDAPWGCARDGADVESMVSVAEAERKGSDPIRNSHFRKCTP